MILIDGYPIDAAISINENNQSTITSDPIENGSSIADHTIDMPLELTIDGVVSDTPIGVMRAIRVGDGVLDINGTSDEDTITPSEQARSRLKKLKADKRPFSIETNRAIYDLMLIESLTFNDSTRSGSSLPFTIKCKQLNIVKNERITVPVKVPRAKRKSPKTTKASQDPDESGRPKPNGPRRSGLTQLGESDTLGNFSDSIIKFAGF